MKAFKKILVLALMVSVCFSSKVFAQEVDEKDLSGNERQKGAQAEAIRVVADMVRRNPEVLKALSRYVEARKRAQEMQAGQ